MYLLSATSNMTEGMGVKLSSSSSWKLSQIYFISSAMTIMIIAANAT